MALPVVPALPRAPLRPSGSARRVAAASRTCSCRERRQPGSSESRRRPACSAARLDGDDGGGRALAGPAVPTSSLWRRRQPARCGLLPPKPLPLYPKPSGGLDAKGQVG